MCVLLIEVGCVNQGVVPMVANKLTQLRGSSVGILTILEHLLGQCNERTDQTQ